MTEEYKPGVYSIPSPRPEMDAASSYQQVAQSQIDADIDAEWEALLGNAPEASPAAAPAASEPQPATTMPETDSAAPAASGGSWADMAKGALADIGKGLFVEAPRQVVGGVADAFDEAGQLLGEMTGIGGISLFDEAGNFNPDYLSWDEWEAAGMEDDLVGLFRTDDPDTATGQFVRSTAQFLTGFIPALKGAKAAGVTGALSSTMMAGAAADMVVFDPHEDRLSTWLNEVPALEPYVSDYLADNNPENESSWEGRLKNAIEGAGLGLAADGTAALFKALKYYKVQRAAKMSFAPDSADAASVAAKDALAAAAREDLVPEVTDEALAGLGVADGPLIATGTADDTAATAFKRLQEAEARQARLALNTDALSKINNIVGNAEPDAVDEMIDAVRKGGVTADLGGKRPVAGIIKGMGGIDPSSGLAAELKARGISAKTHPGVFKKGGLKALDNIPVKEQPIFSARMLDDGQGYVPEQSWIDALADEAKGEPWRTVDQQKLFDEKVAPVEAFREELERLGIDVSELGNDGVKTRLKEVADETDALNRDFAPEDAKPADMADLDDAEMPDQARPKEQTGRVFVNHARIQTSDDVKQVLQEMADMEGAQIKDKTRGTVSNVQTIKESSKEYRDIDELLGRPPGPMTAAQAVAARKLLTSSGEQLVSLAKKAGAENASAADVYAFRRAMSVHSAIQSEVIAARTETARALQSWAIPAGSDKMRGEAINELITQAGGAKDLRNIAKVMAKAGDNPAAVNAMVRETLRGRLGKALYQVWINGLLSSPKTHVVNILSNSMVAAYSIPERYMAAGISKMFYGGEIDAGEAAANLFGAVKGMRDGLRLIYHGNKASEVAGLDDVFDHFAKQEVRVNDISAEAFGLDSAGFGRGFDFLGKAVNLPGTMLEMEDKFFKSLGYRMELNALAYREVAKEGLEGEAAARRMADILADPPENLLADALDVSHYNTFTNPLGKTGKAFQSLLNRIPFGRVVVPFVRTPTNIVKYTFARTPLAYMSGAIRADIKAGGARAAQAHARVALGSMLMVTMADMTLEGTITGRGPEDPRMRKAKMDTGWMPYSVKVGDRWYQYSRTDPIGMIMGIGADIAELSSNANEDEAEMLASAAVLALANNLANKTYLSGIYDFIGAIDPNNPTNDPAKYVGGLAGTLVPYSSLVRQTANTIDPVLRETRTSVTTDEGQEDEVAAYLEGLLDDVRSRIPGMGRDLPPRRDLFGEPITRASGIGWGWDMLSPIASKADNPDPITQIILDNRVPISNPPRVIEGVRLNNEEYSEFSRLAGEGLKERLDAITSSPGFDRLTDGPDGMKSELIQRAVHQSRKVARARMMLENPRLQELKIQRKFEALRKLQGE